MTTPPLDALPSVGIRPKCHKILLSTFCCAVEGPASPPPDAEAAIASIRRKPPRRPRASARTVDRPARWSCARPRIARRQCVGTFAMFAKVQNKEQQTLMRSPRPLLFAFLNRRRPRAAVTTTTARNVRYLYHPLGLEALRARALRRRGTRATARVLPAPRARTPRSSTAKPSRRPFARRSARRSRR